MSRAAGLARRLAAAGVLLILAAAPLAAADPPPGTQVREERQGPVTVRIAVPDAAANARVFGVPLDSRGVQPVWIEIANASPDVAVYLPIVTDPDYFSPREASWRFHERLHPEADAARDALFAASRMPGRIAPGATASGYVFTHRETGLKFVTVGMLRGGDELRFRFIVPVAGPELAVERVDLAKLWPPDAFRDLDLDGLRSALSALPCCGANADGSGKADPLNLVIVGDGLSIVFPLVERGWRFVQPLDLRSAAASAEAFVLDTADPDLPVSPMWLFGRREDLALQKPTSTISQRNHLRLWLTPLRYPGPVGLRRPNLARHRRRVHRQVLVPHHPQDRPRRRFRPRLPVAGSAPLRRRRPLRLRRRRRRLHPVAPRTNLTGDPSSPTACGSS